MANIEYLEPGSIALIQQLPNGRIRQIGLTEAHSKMLQALIGSMSQINPLPALPEEHDLVLKSEVKKDADTALQATIDWYASNTGVVLQSNAIELLKAWINLRIESSKK